MTSDDRESARKQARQELATECSKKIEAARLIKSFIASDAWVKVVLPRLQEEQEKAAINCLWAPNVGSGKPLTLDDVGLRVAYYSGASAAIEHHVKWLNTVLEDGRVAEQDLERMEREK